MAVALAPKIFLIRHAEKPNEEVKGVTSTGSHDPKSLSVRGWQRAGALAHFHAASPDRTPKHLFASHSSSLRPRQTLLPLAEKLGLEVNLNFGKGDEPALAAAAKASQGIVLISWQHEYMAAVANEILGNSSTAPQEWLPERFDLTWIFELDEQTRQYQFSEHPQLLLAGDSPSGITSDHT